MESVINDFLNENWEQFKVFASHYGYSTAEDELQGEVDEALRLDP